MIQNILMRNCASYDNEGAMFDNLAKINFIYGSNGSGKTTVSNYLRNQSDIKYKDCSIGWKDSQREDILVYNRSFREEQIESEIKGIFTLGKESIEMKNEIENLISERDAKTTDIVKLNESFEKNKGEYEIIISNYKKYVWKTIYKSNQELQNAFTGFRSGIDDFFNEFKKRYAIKSDFDGSKEELVNKNKVLYGKDIISIKPIEYAFKQNLDKLNEIERNPLWKKVIAGNKDIPIAEMINILSNESWVRAGLVYVKDNDVCPFCQKHTLDDDFKGQLEKFFDEGYNACVDEMKKMQEQYLLMTMGMYAFLKKVMEDEAFIKYCTKENIEEYRFELQKIELTYKRNLEEIDNKLSDPLQSIQLELVNYDKINSIIDGINEAVSDNAKMYENRKQERINFVGDVWNYLILENKDEIEKHEKERISKEKAISGIERVIEEKKNDLGKLDAKISGLHNQVISVQPTVEKINKMLLNYGFTNFRIVAAGDKENQYQIQREDGSLVEDTLSEGEETFITFLYYMQLANGSTYKEKVSNKKILIIDDPVSSLDSGILFAVSTIVRGIINDIKESKGNIKQIIVLTHNVYFHNEVTYFIDKKHKEKYWIIRKRGGVSSCYYNEHNNPIKSSYALLWDEYKKCDEQMSLVALQNIMRRIIESYFRIIGGVTKIRDMAINSFDTIEEKQICESFFSWINAGSHAIQDDLFVEADLEKIEEYKSVFERVFINTDNKAHYDMMMGKED